MSFRLKTILGIALIEMTVMAILIVVNQLNYGGAASAQLFERVQSTSQLFATLVADAVISYDLATLDAMVANTLLNDDLVYLRVVSMSGAELTAGGLAEALSTPFAADDNFDAALSDHRVDVSYPISIAGQDYGSIQIGVSTLKVEQEMATALRWNMFVAALGMSLVAVFGYLLGSVLTRQLSLLRAGAQKITEGDLGVQISVIGRDELAETADCFNVMAETLLVERDRLEAKQQELEEKRDRTLDIVAMMTDISKGVSDSIVPDADRADEIGDMARATLVFQNAMNEVQAKREEQAQLLHAFDQLDEQVAIFDEDGACIFLNVAFRSYHKDIVRRLPAGFTYDAFLVEGLDQGAFPGASGRQSDWLEDRLRPTTSKAAGAEIAVAPDRTLLLRQTSVAGIGMVISFADVTELKTSQAQLIQASKLATLGEMATGIAHELNQPLGVIRMAANNCLKRIDKGGADPAYLTAKLERMCAQTERAAQIINHMRIFGRSDDGRRDTFEMRPALENVCNLMHKQLHLEGVEIDVDLPSFAAPVVGQQVMFEQVILNLLSNAKDAMVANPPNEGKPTVRVTYDVRENGAESRVFVSVSDNGGGIDPGVAERLFDPFFTTKEPGKGTGLGLSISYGIVRDMGGQISVRNVDHGACFEVILPIDPVVETVQDLAG